MYINKIKLYMINTQLCCHSISLFSIQDFLTPNSTNQMYVNTEVNIEEEWESRSGILM